MLLGTIGANEIAQYYKMLGGGGSLRGFKISFDIPNTVRKALKCQGLKSTIKKKETLHLDHHKPSYYEWAKEHKDWMQG